MNAEERLIQQVMNADARPPEQLSEEERLKRYQGHPFVLEAVLPHRDPSEPPFLGRSPWPGPVEYVRMRAREIMQDGKDIPFVRIRDTRTWVVVAVEKR